MVDLRGFRVDVVRSVRVLEDLSGGKIKGYRAPKWSISDRSRDGVLGVLAEEGFAYDSSFFPGPFGAAPDRCIPHQVKLPAGGSLWEIPATTYPLLNVRLPVAGGLYFRILPEWLSHRALSQRRSGAHPGMIYLHPYDLDPGCPRLPGGGLLNQVKYIGAGPAWNRLEVMLHKFRFCSAANWIASHDCPAERGV
jgi:peptidoglycan/xylan/chitin deacetylase (PgdA/CDA1 family)